MLRFTCVLFCLLSVYCHARNGLQGVWQGVLIPNGKSASEGSPFWLEISESGGKTQFLSRKEDYKTEYYSVRRGKGSVSENDATISEYIISAKKIGTRSTVCKYDLSLNYDPENGYLQGNYKSNDCRNVLGTVVLYRSSAKFPENSSQTSHAWVDEFREDLLAERKAPEIRAAERANFQFQPIYFDYDKAEIRPEYEAFLKEMIRVVSGHSDLRILIIGNTDSDGSDSYNDDLSKRRAEAIVRFFTENGLSRDHLEFEYRGEHDPADTNDTPEGKQRNRRVEFRFI